MDSELWMGWIGEGDGGGTAVGFSEIVYVLRD
jgi:hypothetical protein